MRVLVVDDEADIRFVVSSALDEVEVLEAADGDAALRLLAVEQVDAVLLDVMLPSVDGFAVLARIREQPHLNHLPVVMLTAKAGEADHVAAYRSGADAYLTKPFDIDELARLVDEVMGRTPEQRAELRRRELGRAELLAQLEERFIS